MDFLLEFFNINNTFFSLLGYPISYLEFVGTLFNLVCVWLVARKNILNWPIGLVGVGLFGVLFYQINLYADLFEQMYFFVTGIIGWYMWSKARKPQGSNEQIVVRRNNARTNVAWIAGIVVLTALGTWAMTRIHIWLPVLFPEPASLPLLDTFTTVLSFAATVLMMQRKLENWALWILVDIIAIGLYWYKGVPFIALLYVLFLGIATGGLISWIKTYRRQNDGKQDDTEEARFGHRQVLPAA